MFVNSQYKKILDLNKFVNKKFTSERDSADNYYADIMKKLNDRVTYSKSVDHVNFDFNVNSLTRNELGRNLYALEKDVLIKELSFIYYYYLSDAYGGSYVCNRSEYFYLSH